jgi:transcriptional regulator with GAF, ATPase, and Fis domain/tetratricopeptide (TPR) repeat protein
MLSVWPLGESQALVRVRDEIERLLRSAGGPARRLPPLLILGETGTGKGLLASAIHRASARAGQPFVDVNCAAIPETLLEAELFGFERGAFTDARQAKPGLFQTANGGVVFLDEIGLMPLALQSKLLKVIEERRVRRLGSTRTEALDVSVIAATSEDLPAAVRSGRFRADLYHRLAVVTLALPPLRARGDDVLLLAEHFLARACEDYGLPARGLTEDARTALLAYPWPGNVRELMNVMERAALLTEHRRITAERLELPPAGEAAGASAASGDSEETERSQIIAALTANEWNVTRAATQLGVPRNTLRYRMERLGITPDAPAARRRGGRPSVHRRAAQQAPAIDPAPPASASRTASSATVTTRLTFLELRLAGGEPGPWDTSRALEESVEKMRTFGGRIEELSDTRLLAAFGLEPDEHAPARAAHAAISLQKLIGGGAGGAAGIDVASAAGELVMAIHTETVSVLPDGTIDTADRARSAAALDAMVRTATPGSIVASASAAAFLARRFDLAPLEVAGTPAAACRVLGHAAAGRTRIVGRDRELALMIERFELVQRGRGQVVLVVGEPGIGKSRLLYEFRRRLGRKVTWVEGQALSFGRTIPFHPVIDMLRRVFGIDDADREARVVDKIQRGVRRLGARLDESLPCLRYLLSIDPGDRGVLQMDPRLRHAAIVRATHSLLERGAEMRPHVLVLEDAHWCDAATEDWLARLADRITTKRVLIVVTSRPGYRSPFGDRSFHTGIALSTLSKDETIRIANGLLGADDLPPELEALVLDKAEGNPFFIEELVRSLEELDVVHRDGGRIAVGNRLDAVPVPDTIEEVLLARMRRLDGDLQRVLEIASVVGKDVPFTLLREVCGRPEAALADDLRRLQAAEFLYEMHVFPEAEYTFKHALTHDVAYGSVKADQRRALHGSIVDAVERLYADRLAEYVERLAEHAKRAEQWTRAVEYSRRAGVRAFDRSANRAAVAWFEQALAALARLSKSEEHLEAAIDIRLALRSALLQLGEIRRMTEFLREAESIASVLGDRRRLAWIWTYTTICHLFAGDPRQAAVVGERAFALADESGDSGLRATARTPWAHACRELGDYRRALDLLGETIREMSGERVVQRLGQGMPPALYARSISAVCLAELGEFEGAVQFASEAAEFARLHDLPFGLVLARVAGGYVAIVRGALDEAASGLDEAIALIRERDVPAFLPWAAAARGYAAALAGDVATGMATLEAALERAIALPFLYGHSQWLAWLAHARLVAGRTDDALAPATEALRLSRERGERGYQAWALWMLAEVHSRRAPDAAGTAASEALTLALELGMRPLAARVRETLAGRDR